MDIDRFLRTLDQHVPRARWDRLCRRLDVPEAGAAPSDSLRQWLQVEPEARVTSLLAVLGNRSLLAWARDVGPEARGRETAVQRILAEFLDAAPGFLFDPQRAAQPSRPYQVRCVQALQDAIEQAGWRGRHLIQIGTGGGKTRVANDWISRSIALGKRILWVTKDWELLRQAAQDLCARDRDAAARLARLGGDPQVLPLPEGTAAQVVYTTIQTWTARSDKDFRDVHFDCVVIDELHWGEGGASYKKLLQRYRNEAIVGLTATPRDWTSFRLVDRAYDLPYLVREHYAARPLVQTPEITGVHWHPKLGAAKGDFAEESLVELAASDTRNRHIVKTFVDNQARFGKTLVFACSVDHANRLAAMLQQKGVPAEALHSRVAPTDRDLVRNRFADGHTLVQVNVAMLTHGVDIPDIQTVFLARPTASPTLFWQMVGRGVRLAPGKQSFYVVDFVDIVDRYSDRTLSAERVLGDQFPPPRRHVLARRTPGLKEWEFKPATILRYPGRSGYEELHGLEYQPAQTFGVEFELTCQGFVPGRKPLDWSPIAEELLAALREALGDELVAREPAANPGERSSDLWNVAWEGSCGWKVSTPILMGEEGFEEIHDACPAILEAATDQGLRVDFRTGTLVRLGWQPTADQLKRLVNTVAFFEPALLSLVSPSRAQSRLSRPVRGMLPRASKLRGLREWATAFVDPADRYNALNLTDLFGPHGTVEIRFHNGTQEAKKVLAWLSLWMRILETIQRGRVRNLQGGPNLEALPLCRGPQGDIAQLTRLVNASQELNEYLIDRRAFVLQNEWLQHSDFGPLAREVSSEWSMSIQDDDWNRMQLEWRRVKRQAQKKAARS